MKRKGGGTKRQAGGLRLLQGHPAPRWLPGAGGGSGGAVGKLRVRHRAAETLSTGEGGDGSSFPAAQCPSLAVNPKPTPFGRACIWRACWKTGRRRREHQFHQENLWVSWLMHPPSSPRKRPVPQQPAPGRAGAAALQDLSSAAAVAGQHPELCPPRLQLARRGKAAAAEHEVYQMKQDLQGECD